MKIENERSKPATAARYSDYYVKKIYNTSPTDTFAAAIRTF
jgi:hypothetical protein